MFRSLTGDAIVPPELLREDVPKDQVGDVGYLLDILDREANVDPDFAARHSLRPRPVLPEATATIRAAAVADPSRTDPIVMPKHFGPGSVDLALPNPAR